MKKRVFGLMSLMLVLVMVFAMIVACGSSNNNTVVGNDDDDDVTPPVITPPQTTTHWYDTVDFGGQELVIQLSNANDEELPVGGIKYMQGPASQISTTNASSLEKVQNEVYLRNRAATSKTSGINVSLTYTYIDKVWGSVRGYIVEQERNYAASEKVDLYCDMLYDMMAAGCENGVFANVLKYTATDSGVDGWLGGYFDISTQNGYNVNLMEDMALTEDRQVLLASDYFMDVLRAITILPFNMEVYTNSVNTEDSGAEQLYQMAIDGEWTWDALLSFKDVASAAGSSSMDDDMVLMTMSGGGLTAAALIYSTAFDTYDLQTVGGTTYYKLKSSCSKLYNLFAKAGEVATTRGVVVVSGGSDVENVSSANAKFTSGESLFASINMLGIIEEDSFQSMSQLSIMPVPKLDITSDYSTLINSRARVGAISYNSEKQVAMSAFIQYSTEMSETVKDEYFNNAMQGKYLVGSGAGKVLTMIYNNIGNNKNAILDNLVLARDWNIGKENCWTQIIKADNFTGHASDISAKYQSCITAKQNVLNAAVDAWAACD